MFESILQKWGGKEVSAMEVYTDIFKLGSGAIQKSEIESRNGKSNPLGYWKNRNEEQGHYRILFEDTFEETLKELQNADFAIMNGITYFGRRNTQASASKMFAMIFDLDEITDHTLNNFLSGAIKANAYPIPNYIALSGHGIHLYYVFEEPISLYPNIKIQVKNLKYGLTEKMWNKYTSEDENVQYQGINQGFRPIGGKTKIAGVKVRAFKISEENFTLGQLCDYVLPKYKVDERKLYKESKISIEKAKVLYPEWYEKRVINKEPANGHWVCKRALYDWWIRQIRAGATYHHRYFSIMCLAIYAAKSGISEEELRFDAYSLVPFLENINPGDPFTANDVESALECFDERYCTFPIDDIIRISGIAIEKNKRNGRKRAIHIERVNKQRKYDRDELGEQSYLNNGRPSKKVFVRVWRQAFKNGTKAECIRETGLSRATVYKWWDEVAPRGVDTKLRKGRPTKGEEIREWRNFHKNGTKAECIRETGLSRATVYKWWDETTPGAVRS